MPNVQVASVYGEVFCHTVGRLWCSKGPGTVAAFCRNYFFKSDVKKNLKPRLELEDRPLWPV